MALPLGLPALVGVLGIVEVFGQRGWANRLLAGLGLDSRLEIYGLAGILIAHVFFNMPLAARMVLSGLEAIPHESERLSAQLAFTPVQHWRHVEWPAVRQVLPGALLLVFMLCAASFTIVLTLGGGPSATTLEVAIYQALRFDFDPGQAVVLALLQLLLCATCYLLLSRLGAQVDPGMTLGAPARPVLLRSGRTVGNWLMIAVAGAFIALPLVAIVISGLEAPLGDLLAQSAVWQAAISLAVALAATAGDGRRLVARRGAARRAAAAPSAGVAARARQGRRAHCRSDVGDAADRARGGLVRAGARLRRTVLGRAGRRGGRQRAAGAALRGQDHRAGRAQPCPVL